VNAREKLGRLDGLRSSGSGGPWVLEDDGVYAGLLARNDVGEFVVDYTGLIPLDLDEQKCALADAALIVAAVNALPQLSAALRNVLDLVDQYDKDGEFKGRLPERVRAVITEALS